MVKLYKITEAQAEAMSARHAAKVLAEEKEAGMSEAWHRPLASYALDWDDGGNNPLKDKHGKYIIHNVGSMEFGEAATAWHYWKNKGFSDERLMKLGYGQALGLRKEVKPILEKKVHATIGQFKEHAGPKALERWKKGTEAVRDAVLEAWLKAKGHPSMDAGRRRTRRRHRTRSTRRR